MTTRSEHVIVDKAKWQPVAGFTWELFLIGLAWVIAFGSFVPMVFWVMQGNSHNSESNGSAHRCSRSWSSPP